MYLYFPLCCSEPTNESTLPQDQGYDGRAMLILVSSKLPNLSYVTFPIFCVGLDTEPLV
jgi:hypothetical protein